MLFSVKKFKNAIICTQLSKSVYVIETSISNLMSDSNNPFMHNGIKDWNVQPGADGTE
jgi:hypothetical protein